MLSGLWEPELKLPVEFHFTGMYDENRNIGLSLKGFIQSCLYFCIAALRCEMYKVKQNDKCVQKANQ